MQLSIHINKLNIVSSGPASQWIPDSKVNYIQIRDACIWSCTPYASLWSCVSRYFSLPFSSVNSSFLEPLCNAQSLSKMGEQAVIDTEQTLFLCLFLSWDSCSSNSSGADVYTLQCRQPHPGGDLALPHLLWGEGSPSTQWRWHLPFPVNLNSTLRKKHPSDTSIDFLMIGTLGWTLQPATNEITDTWESQ